MFFLEVLFWRNYKKKKDRLFLVHAIPFTNDSTRQAIPVQAVPYLYHVKDSHFSRRQLLTFLPCKILNSRPRRYHAEVPNPGPPSPRSALPRLGPDP